MAVRKPPGSGAPAARRHKPSAYELIKQAITDGEIAPGEPLIETALAEWCQVSRTPVREALTRLEQDGLVTRTDRGLVVRARSQEEALDIYESRIVLEGTVARMAASRRTLIDLINLRRAEKAMHDVHVGNESMMVSANRDFHRVLWRASHNESLIDLLTRLDLHLSRYSATTLSQPGRWEEANAEHQEIVDAIEQQDAIRAENLARGHFTRARDLRLVSLAAGDGEEPSRTRGVRASRVK